MYAKLSKFVQYQFADKKPHNGTFMISNLFAEFTVWVEAFLLEAFNRCGITNKIFANKVIYILYCLFIINMSRSVNI